MRIRWLASATHSLRTQLAFIAEDNPVAATRIRRRIHEAVRKLSTFPNSGRSGIVVGTRELIVPGCPFLVVYRLTAETVEILRVSHTATNWQGAPL